MSKEMIEEVHIQYPPELLKQLENAVSSCPGRTGNFRQDRAEMKKLAAALEPVMKIRGEALSVPEGLTERAKYELKYNGETVIKRVYLDQKAEDLIVACMEKQNELA